MGRFISVYVGILILGVATPPIAAGNLYKWVDKQGSVHFSDRPPVDPEQQPQSPIETRIKPGSAPVQQPRSPIAAQPSADTGGHEAAAAEKKRRSPQPQVEMYATSWCKYCARARAFFKANDIRFTEHDIEKDKQAAVEHNRLAPNGGVPFIVVGNRHQIHGFDEGELRRLLNLD